MKIYHNPRCSKSRTTLALIEEAGKKATIIPYLDTPPTEKELTKLIKLLNIKPFDLVRKGESVFKENFKGKELSDKEWIKAMIDHPKLIERPIVINKGKAIIGRPPEKVLDIL